MESLFKLSLKEMQKIPPWVLGKFSRPEGFSFSYGQYVRVDFPQGGKKYLAIASSPHKDKELLFLMKLPDLGDLPQEVHVSEPMGGFCQIQEKERLFFITHGVGISAFTGLLYDIAQGYLKKDILALWGIRSPREKELLSQLGIPLNLVTTVYSREGEGLRGYVQDHIEKFLSPDFACYISGSTDMARSTEEKLLSLGIPKSQIFYNF